MSEQHHTDKHESDGIVDAVAALAVMTIIVVTVIYWLSGMQ